MDVTHAYAPTSAAIDGSLRRTTARWAGIAVLALAAGLFTATSVGGGAAGYGAAVLRATMVAAPLAAAAYAWNLVPYRRFAQVLLVVGLTTWVTTLAESSDPVAYGVGRIAGWVLEAELVYLLLAFPLGRPRERADTFLAWAMAVVVAVMYLPTAFFAASYPVPSPWTSCIENCPTNAFFVLDEEPGFIQAERLVAAIAVLAVMVAVLARLHRTAAHASPLTRQVITPVLVVGALRVAFVGVVIVAREWLDEAWEIRASAWLIAIATPAIALSFLYGLVRARLHADRVVWRLATRAQNAPDAERLREAIADAIADPSIEILFPLPGRPQLWQDAAGQLIALPEERSGRRAHLVQDGRRVIAAIVHDERLGAQPELLDTVSSLAALALDRQRATVAQQAAVAATHAERRRIERDLHDGAQQRLIALRIELGLVEAMATTNPALTATRLRALQTAVEEALCELRALAHGASPPALADRGLEEAVREVAARSPLATSVATRDLSRYAVEVETAVYFCVAEALQNAAKHAAGSCQALVDLRDHEGALLFVVRDDGRMPGGTTITPGEGIRNMRERVAALDGTLTVTRPPGGGVEVRGWIPLPFAADPSVPDREALA